MSCKSVEVEKTDKSLTFVGEPAMTIKSDNSSSYTDYITTHYDSIAYYDEPLFLKMKELIKLILAMEWLKERGFKFNKKWMTERTQQKNPLSTKAIEVVDVNMTKDLLKQFIENLPKPPDETQKIMTRFGSVQVYVNGNILKTETGCIIELTQSVPDLSIEETVSIRASTNDYNMLYEGFDLKQPIAITSGELIVPDVTTWSELFAETVPWPTLWIFPYDGDGIPAFSGGVSTQSIPINERVPVSQPVKTAPKESTKVPCNQYAMGGNKVQVKGSTKVKQEVPALTESRVPTRKRYEKPPTDVPCDTRDAQVNKKCKESGEKDAIGWEDQAQTIIYSREGAQLSKQVGLRRSVQCVIKSTLGKTIDESNFPLPPLEAVVKQPMDTFPSSILPQQPAVAPKGIYSPASSVSGWSSSTPTVIDSGLISITSSQLLSAVYIPQQGASGINTPDLLSPTDHDSAISISNDSHGDDEESVTEIEDNDEPDGGLTE